MDIDYTPTKTCSEFMSCDAKMRVLMGPVGSGKSVSSCFGVIRRASQQKVNAQGIRKSRVAIVRETARQLQDTTIKTFLDWFPPGVCGRFMRTTKTFLFKVGEVECEIMFRALDDADDVANLNSLELTFAWFNECRDIHPDIINVLAVFHLLKMAGHHGLVCGVTLIPRLWILGGTIKWKDLILKMELALTIMGGKYLNNHRGVVHTQRI